VNHKIDRSVHDFKVLLSGIVFLTQRELNALHNYDNSYPTGTTIGKQWLRKFPNGETKLCEYTKSIVKGQMNITFKRIIIIKGK